MAAAPGAGCERQAHALPLSVKDGKEIEKLAREFAVFAGGHADITFDVERVGDFNLHKVVLSNVPEEVEKIFGTKTVWVAVSTPTSPSASNPTDRDPRRAEAKPVAVPVLNAEISLAKLLPMVAKELKPEEVTRFSRRRSRRGHSGTTTCTLP